MPPVQRGPEAHPMKESRPKSSPAQDEKPRQPRGPKGAPLGTHSLTGSSEAVGIPSPPAQHEHQDPTDAPFGTDIKSPASRQP
jgi:hypothetical protein